MGASAAKLSDGGVKTPEKDAVAIEGIKVDMKTAKDKDPFAEANALREKRYVIEDQLGNRKPSNSQSAQIAQLKTMERAARAEANKKVQRAAAATAQAEAAEANDDKFSKITGIKL